MTWRAMRSISCSSPWRSVMSPKSIWARIRAKGSFLRLVGRVGQKRALYLISFLEAVEREIESGDDRKKFCREPACRQAP